MLRKIRIIVAAVFFTMVTLLFLDFTGSVHIWFGWMAKVQFIPAVLAMNFAVVLFLILTTFIFGRVYCSVICPLGIFQDIISWTRGKMSRKNMYRFSWTPAKPLLRYGILILFIFAMIAGAGSFAALIAPYSAYGRIAANIFAPVYGFCNNIMAYLAERADSYAFYTADIWIKSISTFLTALATAAAIAILSWKKGRLYCNTVCPVGSVLGIISRHSLLVPSIDASKCRNCRLCERRCKSSCINIGKKEIDYSRCVVCMDCVDVCRDGAIKYSIRKPGNRSRIPENMKEGKSVDKRNGRRAFLATCTAAAAAATAGAQEMKVDGGLAAITAKKAPKRQIPLKPAGSLSLRHFSDHCTACQLCVSVCPGNVLRPSASLQTFMQPEMSFERGWCRPECSKCSEVCPSGPIIRIRPEEKTGIQIGYATVIYENCVVNTDGVSCGNCARHCPSGAISMVRKNPNDKNSPKIPVVNEERCIGCGACEYLCPARPFSAIYVEGRETHRNI